MLPGSIIACHGSGFISDVINAATFGWMGRDVSHVGILADYQGEDALFESTSLEKMPCLIQGKCVEGVQCHHLVDMIANYDGKVWEYPLAIPLDQDESAELTKFVLSKIGTPYDFEGAVESTEPVPRKPENLTKLFCSEFVAAALRQIGRFHTKDASAFNPNRLIYILQDEGIVLPPIRLK